MRADLLIRAMVPGVTEMREIAERVLFAETLEEKLRLGPVAAMDETPGQAIVLPDGPGRPRELRVRGGKGAGSKSWQKH